MCIFCPCANVSCKPFKATEASMPAPPSRCFSRRASGRTAASAIIGKSKSGAAASVCFSVAAARSGMCRKEHCSRQGRHFRQNIKPSVPTARNRLCRTPRRITIMCAQTARRCFSPCSPRRRLTPVTARRFSNLPRPFPMQSPQKQTAHRELLRFMFTLFPMDRCCNFTRSVIKYNKTMISAEKGTRL